MKKVVIIGAGPAGLTAAYELLKNDGNKEYRVTVLEEGNMLGGISQTVRYNGNRMDIGGHRFFSKDDRIMKWWSDMLPLQSAPAYDDKILGREKSYVKGNADPEKTDEVMLIRERVSRIYYKNCFFDYPVTMNFNTIKNMGLLTTLKAGFSYLYACVFKLQENNLENFYINRFGKVLYSMFFEEYTEKLWGRHPREISADWGAQRVKGLSILAIIKDMIYKLLGIKNKNTETSLIDKFWYPKFGPGQLWELVGSRVEAMGGEILKNHEVCKISANDDRITSVTCKIENGEVIIDGDIFISSMPVNNLILGLEGACDNEIREIAKGLSYRDFVTVGLLVDKLELQNKTDKKTLGNIVPDCWIYVQDKGVKLGRIQIFNNWSPYMVKNPEKQVWIGLEYFCNEGDNFWNMTDEECIVYAKNELVKMGIIRQGAVLDAHREKVRKAYPAYFDTYKDFDKVVTYLNRFDNLFCVGRNGQHRYNNMDHSMLTAINAVKAIKTNSTDKTEVWNVNTERSYHESK